MSPDDTINLRRLGENLAREREKRGLSRRQIAAFLGKTVSEVAAYERGEDISVTTMERLADLYGHTPTYFFGGKDEESLPTIGLLSPTATKQTLLAVEWINGFIRAMDELEEILGA